MSATVTIKNATQSFRSGFWMKKKEVLHGIDLEIQKNAVIGLLGPNGAGKTTLIHLIVGLRRPSSGEVLIEGISSTEVSARRKMGYLPERPYFYDHLTGNQMLSHFGLLSGMSDKDLKEKIKNVLKTVGLKGAENKELRKYSKGMLQRIGIAQAILADPEILILDEPMSGLDPIGRKDVRDLIRELASQGKTILFSSHVIPDVEAICDQIAVLNQGELTTSGKIGELLVKGPIRTEVAFAGVDFENAKTLSGATIEVQKIPDGVSLILSSQDEVGKVLSKLIEMNAKILWVSPQRPSLEEFF